MPQPLPEPTTPTPAPSAALSSAVSSSETELKFIVPPAALAGVARAMRQGRVRRQRLQAIYFDTDDERLAAHGAALRLRKEGSSWVQTAKAMTPDALRRLEHNVHRAPSPGGHAPALDLALHDGTPVGAALRVALAPTSPGAPAAVLGQRYRTDVSRLTRLAQLGDAQVELALDTGRIIAGRSASALCELEFELVAGPVSALIVFAAGWVGEHGLWLSTVSKAEQGQRLVHGVPHGPPAQAVAPLADAQGGAHGFLVAVLQSCLQQVLANASEIAAGATDGRYVHQLRVGLRRLRTALRELGHQAQGLDPASVAALQQTFQALGALRDQDTVLPAIRQEMAAAGVPGAGDGLASDGSADVGDPPHPSPATLVRDPAFQRALLAVLAFCHATAPRPETHGHDRLRKQIARKLARLHARIADDAGAFDKLSPKRQHAVRKRVKRLRYLAEFAAPLFDAPRVQRYLQHWREAQDALGENNDHHIGLAALRAEHRGGKAGRAAVTWMKKRLAACVKRCDRALRRAVKHRGFWAD